MMAVAMSSGILFELAERHAQVHHQALEELPSPLMACDIGDERQVPHFVQCRVMRFFGRLTARDVMFLGHAKMAL